MVLLSGISPPQPTLEPTPTPTPTLTPTHTLEQPPGPGRLCRAAGAVEALEEGLGLRLDGPDLGEGPLVRHQASQHLLQVPQVRRRPGPL